MILLDNTLIKKLNNNINWITIRIKNHSVKDIYKNVIGMIKL
jgi:hypothetical protein